MDNFSNPNAGGINQTPQIKKRILIVEDDFFIRDLYDLQANKAGYEVITATDGQEALTKIDQILPDLILIDLMLPKMDGLTLLKSIKANSKFVNVPCIIVTNLEDATKEQEAKMSGASEYLLKIKNTPEVVVETFKKYLH